MNKYGDLDYFVNEAEEELAEDRDPSIETEDGLIEVDPEPRPYWNGVPH